jgi:hypothetical protein
VVDVGIRMRQSPSALIGISGEAPQHVFVNFLLQVGTHGTIGTNDLVGADTSV